MAFKFNKQYIGQHLVIYSGKMDGNVFAGKWTIPGNCSNKFQIKCDAPVWSGWFECNGSRTNMFLSMAVQQTGIVGHGKDELGTFTIRGEVIGDGVTFAKQYWGSHTVFLRGIMDPGRSHINGEWMIPNQMRGSFQLHK